jgi:UDP-glucose 4-epimerase
MEEPNTCFEVNVFGTQQLLEAARKVGVQQVVLASSAAVYGDSEAIPLREDTTLSSLSPYAASKQMNEVSAKLYTQAFGLKVVALRYFNVYGPRQSPESPYAAVIPIFTQRLLSGLPPVVFGDGLQSRDFIAVKDVVRANIIASENPEAAGKVFNICTGMEVSLLQLLQTLSSLIPNALEPEFSDPRPGDIIRSIGDPTLAASELPFSAQTTLQEGLKRTIDWMHK